MSSYNLTLQDLQQIIGSENLNLPAGNVQDQNQNLPIRITGQFTSIEDIKELPIPTQSGVIKLENLAEIKEAYADADQLSYLNGKEAVGISVLKQSGANTVSVANEIDDRLKELNQTLPEGVKIDTILDQSDFINQSIKSVTSNMIVGSILASIILYLFLRNLRSTIIIGLAIPLSIVTTFVFMYFSGQTLNLLTLGGLALGIGMMVDNAIVILENIFRLRKQGLSKKDAAIKGTNQVGTAIIASTLTTVVVFLPIVFVDGLAAQLFKPLALVISFSLLASLFTALIIVPLFSSLFLKLSTREKEQSNTDGKLFGKVKHFYKRRLDTALRHPKKTVGAVLLLFALSFAGIPFIGTEFLPAQDQSTVSVTAKLPQGTALEATYEKTEEINEILKDIPEVDLSSVTVGGSNNFSGSAGSNTNQATYNILLKPVDERDRSDKEIADEIRNKLNDIPSVDATVSSSEGGFTGDPISLEISGPDLDELVRISDQTVDILSEIDGVREPESSYNDGNPEVVISINRDKASQYGIEVHKSPARYQKLHKALSLASLLVTVKS